MVAMTDAEFRKMQADALSDALQELLSISPDFAKEAMVNAVKGWYDYHYQEMQKWKMLEEMLRSGPSWTGSMEMK